MLQLQVLNQEFTICQVPDYSQVNFEADFSFIGQTDEEKSLVCYSQDLPANANQIDGAWSAFRIQGVLDFSLV